jgi:hypothetical protein
MSRSDLNKFTLKVVITKKQQYRTPDYHTPEIRPVGADVKDFENAPTIEINMVNTKPA